MADLREFENRLNGSFNRVGPQIAELAKRSIRANFRAGGRPIPWQPSARVLSGHKTLVKTRNLMTSFSHLVTPRRIVIGTNVQYAAIHNFGFRGTVNVRAQQVRAHTRTLRGKRATVRAHERAAHSMRMRMPQRKFMMLQSDDVVQIKRMIHEDLMRSFRR